MECRECMGDISGIRPVEKAEEIEIAERDIASDTSATVRDVRKTLVLVVISARGGDNLPVKDGDILGREHAGSDLFAAFNTVSRRHAKITGPGGEWAIEDMGSTNGTYVNGRKLEVGKKYPIEANDIVALSKSCEFRVEIGRVKI